MAMSGSQIPTRLGIIWVPLVLLSSPARGDTAAPAEPAAAATSPSNDDCLGCHSNSLDRSKGRAIPSIGEAFADSVHGQINLACVDCHVDLQGKDLPHADKLAKPVCSQCHEDAVKAYDQSVHAGSRRKSSDSDAAWCSDCHGMHDIRSAKDPQSKTYTSTCRPRAAGVTPTRPSSPRPTSKPATFRRISRTASTAGP